ncbi:hypothetical protein O6H91_01G127100 [Diphasiastrum complanatum]|uniref:Uncharacterized protein n=1 Tax=Diphasiastrum complanatum TaxID=34168 RepID=A0ACC2EVP8_DIPCM|nr:hypothetical protein O6H91_01G127100 [Diphasiastrum complanatum]
MLGKRSRSFSRTSSVVFMASEYVPVECLPPAKHSEEMDRPSHFPSPPIQVIGFNPKVCYGKEEEKECLNQCVKPSVSPKSARPTSGLECLLSSARSPCKHHHIIQTVGLGIVAAFDADSNQPKQQDQSIRIEGECGCLLHGTAVRGNADIPSLSKQDLQVFTLTTASKPSQPIPISPSPLQQPALSRRIANESPHNDPFEPQNLSVWGDVESMAEKAEGSNFSGEQRTGLAAQKCVFTLLASSPGATETADSASLATMDFMEACFLCNRHLGHGRDIFMYRGDRAFCSVECRHQQILLDERAERTQKCSSAAYSMGNGAQSRRRNHRNRVLSAGTAAAA